MRTLYLLLASPLLLFAWEECLDTSISEYWRPSHGRAFLCKDDTYCNYCPMKYSACTAKYKSKETGIEKKCYVCYDTNELRNHQTKNLASLESCTAMTVRNTKIIVIPISKWSKCKSPSSDSRDFSNIWEDNLKAGYIANIIEGRQHILFRVQFKFMQQVCEKSFADCGQENDIRESTVRSTNLVALSDCMKCSCPWQSFDTTTNTYKRKEKLSHTRKTNKPESVENKNEESTFDQEIGAAVGGGAILIVGIGVCGFFVYRKIKKNRAEQEQVR